MMKPMTGMQKIIAYTSLVIIIFWILFGLFTFWVYLSE